MKHPPAARTPDPVGALAAARVDLLGMIAKGIPQRSYVPGAEPWLIRGKRYLTPAPAGTGKSLVALVVALDVVAAGGTVSILDVENGADEYARRLADVLDARGADEHLRQGIEHRLRYFAWPAMRLDWPSDAWAKAHSGSDLVVFDSSRLTLSAVGLDEDSNDDYATFAHALLTPLTRSGSTTWVLDNMGHEAKSRARGASAKGDLNEVIYLLQVGTPFDREQQGHVRLVRGRTRFPDLPGELCVPLGGGTYGPVREAEAGPDSTGFRPTGQMERLSRVLEERPGLNSTELLAMVSGRREYKQLALALLIEERFVRAELEGRSKRHYSLRAFREADEVPGTDQVPRGSGEPGNQVPGSRSPRPEPGNHVLGNLDPLQNSHGALETSRSPG